MKLNGLTLALGGLTALTVLSAGCASVVPAAPVGTATALPDWVLVVPPPGPERVFYVGGCAAAPDTGSGIVEAVADARAQAGKAARERIAPLVDNSFHEAGVETEALERAEFRLLVVEPVVEGLAGALRRQKVFYRECADPAAPSSGATRVCDVFVLMTVEREAWERLPLEIMGDIRKQRQSKVGGSTSVALLDWVLRRYVETEPADQAGGRDPERP
jgi:hypothetical protein